MSTTLANAVNGAAAPKVNDHPTIIRIQAKAEEFAKAMPSVMTKDRFMRIAIGAIRKNPKLLECDPLSLMGSLLVAAQLGFEVNTPLGHFFLIPRWNKTTHQMEADGQIGYKGWIELLQRSGQVQSMVAETVFENDYFDYALGDDPKIEHKPSMSERGRAIAYYVSVRIKNGGVFRKVLSWQDIQRYRARSRTPNAGPWVSDFDAMALKTTFMRLTPWLPKSIEMQRAEAFENTIEANGTVVYREKQNQIDYVIPEPAALPEPESEPQFEPDDDGFVADAEVVETARPVEQKAAPKAPRKRQPAAKMEVISEKVGPPIEAPFDGQPANDTRVRQRPESAKQEAKPNSLASTVQAIEAWSIEAAAKHDAEGLPDLADKTYLLQRVYEVMVRMGILQTGLTGFYTQANAIAKVGIDAGYDVRSYLEEANGVVREEYLGVPEETESETQEQPEPAAKPSKKSETDAEKMAAIEKWFEAAAEEFGNQGHRSLVMPSAAVAAVYSLAHKAGLILGAGQAIGYRTRLIEIAEIPGSSHDVIQKMKPFCKQLLAELEAPEPGSDG